MVFRYHKNKYLEYLREVQTDRVHTQNRSFEIHTSQIIPSGYLTEWFHSL